MIGLIRNRPGAACVLVVFVAMGCALAPGAQGQEPAGRPVHIDSTTNAQFRAYLRTLRFAVDSEAGDRQALLVGRYPESARFGALATILPEVDACRLSPEAYVDGRVIARIDNESADSYPRLGLLPHATTYWWVQYNPATERADSRFVTVDKDSTIIGTTAAGLEIISGHKEFQLTQPLARFGWTAVGELPWACCSGRCCRTRDIPR